MQTVCSNPVTTSDGIILCDVPVNQPQDLITGEIVGQIILFAFILNLIVYGLISLRKVI